MVSCDAVCRPCPRTKAFWSPGTLQEGRGKVVEVKEQPLTPIEIEDDGQRAH